jgi:hypothetical protein
MPNGRQHKNLNATIRGRPSSGVGSLIPSPKATNTKAQEAANEMSGSLGITPRKPPSL